MRKLLFGVVALFVAFGGLTAAFPCQLRYAAVSHWVMTTVHAAPQDSQPPCTCAGDEGAPCWTIDCEATSWGCGIFWTQPCTTRPCYEGCPPPPGDQT